MYYEWYLQYNGLQIKIKQAKVLTCVSNEKGKKNKTKNV